MFKRAFIVFIISLLTPLFFSQQILAWQTNNKFGIHILEPTDLPKAAELVNSSGGDWGYVTTVLREKDMDQGKWQGFFDDCRKQHLIPLVRLATESLPEGYWSKPTLPDLEKWPEFLGKLNWPVKQQIVIVFNEPNHTHEWGGQIDPQDYTLILARIIKLFKEKNENFFILNAGLDQAAGNTAKTRDELVFLQAMAQTVPGIFNQLDGWSSHSYPNYGFVGKPSDQGRATIRGYQWELAVLKNLGLEKELPVYITETGWPHREGVEEAESFFAEHEVASFFQEAFALWQKDAAVKAVTPFVLNYPLPPFAHFSWLKEGGAPYTQFNQVLGISKERALPEQIQNYEITKVRIPDILPTDYLYSHGQIAIKNTGQWIMAEREEFRLKTEQSEPEIQISEIKLTAGELLLPGKEKTLSFSLKTGLQPAEHQLRLGEQNFKILVFKPGDFQDGQVSLWQQTITLLKLWWLDLWS